MCLPESQKPTDDSSLSDEDLAPEEQSDEDIVSVSDEHLHDSSSDSSIGNYIKRLNIHHNYPRH